MSTPLLEVRDLRVYLQTREGPVRAVDGAGFAIRRGESLGIVGESGSGKSMSCQAIIQVLPQPAAAIESGQILLDGDNLLLKSRRAMQQIRGARIGMILQDPLNSLNPVLSIGAQLVESLRLSDAGASRAELHRQAAAALERVGIAGNAGRLDAYPHEFSGGMRQRVAAAIAIARKPDLLIADEPTTALDVTTQDQFLDMLNALKRDQGMSLLLVSHDMGVVARCCDRVAVMYGGRVVESGSSSDILESPKHPYTRALMRAVPQLHGPRQARLFQIPGEPPNNRAMPAGCHFAPRCDKADATCHAQYPPTVIYRSGASAACWRCLPANGGDT